MRHPGEAELALFGGDDLGWWQRRRVSRHLARCAACRELAGAFRSDQAALQDLVRNIPADLDWSRLTAEMKANIHVGLVAGQCVEPTPRPHDRLSWRAALGLASLTALILTGWWLHIPASDFKPPAPVADAYHQEVVLEATPDGVELKQGNGALTLRQPASQTAVLTVSTQGSVRARYVDSETGQVTINNVYVQ